MIRINLLPIRAFKRREKLRKQVFLYLVTIALLIGAMAVLYLNEYSAVRELRVEKAELAAKEADLAKTVKEVAELKKEQEDLQRKVDVIQSLEERRQGPVRVLAEISRRLPEQRAYLESLSKKFVNGKDTITMTGIALDNETIAAYMSDLESTDLFTNVELVYSRGPEVKAMAAQNAGGGFKLFATGEESSYRLKWFSITTDVVLNPDKQEGEDEAEKTAKAN